ncbi:Uncharacterised protein [Amycolatopsis camponoti]|uniref:Uncharacterized protein n=1 Tax=Amycolatopsis camponoti TaxID=2606593 RepID=A0A6I8LXV5_9PSEU|nr:Uncharacterised protein [Amycolatopsis camponoti]
MILCRPVRIILLGRSDPNRFRVRFRSPLPSRIRPPPRVSPTGRISGNHFDPAEQIGTA